MLSISDQKSFLRSGELFYLFKNGTVLKAVFNQGKSELMKEVSPVKLFGGILIVGGTAIGAGMLALPVATASNGFYPSILAFFLVYLFSMATGLLFLELCLAMPNGTNIISMARHYLGPKGKMGAWILYVILFYSLMVAYVDGGSGMVQALFSGYLSNFVSMALFVFIFGAILFFGTSLVDRINRALMMGLIVAFISFAIFAIKEVDTSHFKAFTWKGSLLALPVIFTSFSYQGTLPSLMHYLERNKKAMQYAIVVGISVPFLIYIFWQFLVMGVVPLEGSYGLLSAKREGTTAVAPLRYFVKSPKIALFGEVFGFCALSSSLLGVALGMLDFLSDGLKIEKKRGGRLFLCLLIFIPAMLITLYNPGIFLITLGYAGGIGCALLLGLYPTLMVWKARYSMPGVHPRVLFGGRPMLLLLVAFVILELGLEVVKNLQLF